MRIVFLSFYSGRIDRGVEVATEALARGLSRHHEVTVFQAGSRTVPQVETVQLPVENKWPTDTSSSWWRLFYLDYYSRKILTFTLKFLPYLFRNKYDVLIPTNGGWQVLLIRAATWLLGKQMIVQGNAGIGRDDFWQLMTFPNLFIAISPQGYEWAKRRAPWINISYIPYGVDLQEFRLAQPISVLLKKPVVLCVGAFSPYKRIDLLINAVVKIPSLSLLVIGQGPLEKELQQLGDQVLGKRFMLKTGVTHSELIRYYKSADVFSLPSKSSEALGIVYIEAMAAGLPVVAPDDWRKQIIGEAGIYADPEDRASYAKAIELALAKDFGDIPLKQAEKYKWDIIVNQYEKLIKGLNN